MHRRAVMTGGKRVSLARAVSGPNAGTFGNAHHRSINRERVANRIRQKRCPTGRRAVVGVVKWQRLQYPLFRRHSPQAGGPATAGGVAAEAMS